MTLPSNTPAILREAGLQVKEHSGWQTRGHGAFSNVGVLCHHTATGPTTSNTNVINLLIKGRSDLAGPLCNFGLDRDGVVHIIAAGKAYHAGAAKASGTMAANSSGNNVYIGIEAFNSGIGERWNKKQYDAYVLLCAVLSKKITGNSSETVRAHKETSITGKIDPYGPTPYEGSFDMAKFRARVKAKMAALGSPESPAWEPNFDIQSDYPIVAEQFNKYGTVAKKRYHGVGFIQHALNYKFNQNVDVDGIVGEDTMQAMVAAGFGRTLDVDDLRKMQILYRFTNTESTPAPAPKPVPEVKTHARWTTQATEALDSPTGKVVREIPEGYKLAIVDGSGSAGSPYIKTSSGEWVNGNHTTKTAPGNAFLSTMTWNVENKGDEVADVTEIKKILAVEKPDVVCIQEGYKLYLGGIPGYKEVYHASKGYPVGSENAAQAIIVRDGVAVKSKSPIVMTLEWIGPKLGIRHEPRVHRYVTVNKDGRNWRVSTWHVPFGTNPVEETRKAAVDWLRKMGLLGPAIAVGDWNALANNLQTKVGTPAGAKTDGGGKDRAVYKNCTKSSSKNLGNRGRSDHDAKIWNWKK